MKNFILSMALFLTSFVSIQNAFAETHYEARNCEIFIDRLSLIYGSHASLTVVVDIKTINSFLNGRIVEVGFRQKAYWADGYHWGNSILQRKADDYFETSFSIGGGDYGTFTSSEGVFYVKTDKDTYYWIHPAHRMDQNFSFDESTYKAIIDDGRSGTPDTRSGELRDYNPDGCR